MDDIAEHMHISKKTIYQYFGDKTSLIRSAVFHVFEEVKDNIIAVQSSIDNPIKALYETKKIAVEVLGKKEKSPQYQLQKYYPTIYAEIRKKELSAFGETFKMSLKKEWKWDFSGLLSIPNLLHGSTSMVLEVYEI